MIASLIRVKKEIANLQCKDFYVVTHDNEPSYNKDNENINIIDDTQFKCIICYREYIFHITFTADYPFSSPYVKFSNLVTNNELRDYDILNWTPVCDIKTLILSIYAKITKQ